MQADERNDKNITYYKNKMSLIQSTIRNLETQAGQIVEEAKEKSHKTFPCDIERNRKDCMAVTLRSGMKLQGSQFEEKYEQWSVKKEQSKRRMIRNYSKKLKEKRNKYMFQHLHISLYSLFLKGSKRPSLMNNLINFECVQKS